MANKPSAETEGEELKIAISQANKEITILGLIDQTVRVEKFQEELRALVEGFDSHCVRRVAVPVRV